MEQNYEFKLDKLTVGYEGKSLIRDITLSLEKGRILTLIGPNGAGKSTILKSIARQLAALGGRMYFGEKDLAACSREELARTMAVVLTDRLHTELMTCRDVVAFGRYPYTGRFGLLSAEDKEKIERAMELVHVQELSEKDYGRISDGQRQRVLLARAICQEPELLILDEPTSYLDIKYKLEFLSILLKLQKEKGLTVIMSLHELELVSQVSDRILCVRGEYADRYGTPEEILQEEYICGLFGIPKELQRSDLGKEILSSILT